MIATDADAVFGALAAQLEQQAAALADAHRQSAELARAGDPARWRHPDLLWPTFGGEPR